MLRIQPKDQIKRHFQHQFMHPYSALLCEDAPHQFVWQFYSSEATSRSLQCCQQVLLDGVDLRKLDISWMREQLSLVSQEPHLFTGTIRDNITYGKPGASEDEVREAAASANALDFIQAAPSGFDTLVSKSLLLCKRECQQLRFFIPEYISDCWASLGYLGIRLQTCYSK